MNSFDHGIERERSFRIDAQPKISRTGKEKKEKKKKKEDKNLFCFIALARVFKVNYFKFY